MNGLKKAARISQIAIGLIFVVSGAVKVWEPVLFYWDTIPYTQLLGVSGMWEEIAHAALLLAPFECALGMALLVNWRPRLTGSVATVLLVYFIGLMGYAWHQGASVDCGCFGTLIERSPKAAAIEDLGMLALLLFGWWGAPRQPACRWPGRLVLAGAVLSLGVGSIRFFPARDRLENSDLLPGVKLIGLNPQGVSVDLMQGEHLIELMSPRCGHCMDAVPRLNRLVEATDLPPLVALCSFPQDDQALIDFKKRLEPRFEIGTISRTDFFRLTWKHGYPRLAHINDGVVRRVWEHDQLPEPEEMREALAVP
jgi:hypothetical protein